MSTLALPEFLEDCDGVMQFKGHRICLHHVVRRFNEGYSPEAIASDFYPTLSLLLIYKAITYYLDNRLAVDAMIAGVDAELARQEAKYSAGPGYAELRLRLEARRRA
ncbi:MAG: DUF433 domain-containing protein [Tepidisphaeraceae bacterium]|jgi:uncharacterized protein (DUF433 family)